MNQEILDVFAAVGLSWCRRIGDKRTHNRDHPDSIYLPGARVFDQTQLLWIGDLDLSGPDASRLQQVSINLEKTLVIHSEATCTPALPDPKINAVAFVEAGKIEITAQGLAYAPSSMRRGKVRITIS